SSFGEPGSVSNFRHDSESRSSRLAIPEPGSGPRMRARERFHRRLVSVALSESFGGAGTTVSHPDFGRRVEVIIRSSRPRIRSTVVMLAVAGLAIAGMVAAMARSAIDEVGVVAAGAVEDDGANCPVTLPGSLTANAKLPDPFTRLDGTRIVAKSDWRCR